MFYSTRIFLILILATSFFISTCAVRNKEKADLIVYNAAVYTVNGNADVVQSFAVKNGKIIAAGSSEDILAKYESDNKIDAGGKPVYPGFIDSHCHFLGYGLSLQRINLTGTQSYADVLTKVKEFSENSKSEWILGRGWDQNDWEIKEFPDRTALDSLFPDKPVFLKRIDGHAALVNAEVLKRAKITPDTKVEGGLIEVKNGRLTGILIDNAVDIADTLIPEPDKILRTDALLKAAENCFAVGLTTVSDAGLDIDEIELIKELGRQGKLKMRIYAMISGYKKENIDHFIKSGKYKDDYLNVSSFKFYADGALGSRGACLLQDYSDKAGHRGFLIDSIQNYRKYAGLMYDNGFQMNTHCIGDSANRLMLGVYGEILKGRNDRRWRIEHAQVVSKNDIPKFGLYSIIPAVQPVHATSDMYWAGERLGGERVKTAYAYKDLLESAGIVSYGSDFPVEDINPLLGFFAAVARKDAKGFPEGGYQAENSLSREEALKSLTIWAAFANFEDNEKGSLEAGKFADFVILDKDIMKVDLNEILTVKVIYTYINGQKVFGK